LFANQFMIMKSLKNFEVIEKESFSKFFETEKEYYQEYAKHIGYGSSGSFYIERDYGCIHSFMRVCKLLETQGYKNLNFCNGGDDDILIVDHNNKEFGFFENPGPQEEALNQYENLAQLWKSIP
jgi:hypothetical protein